MLAFLNRSLQGSLAVACLIFCIVQRAEAQQSLAAAKQAAFERSADWTALKQAMRGVRDSLGVDPIWVGGTPLDGSLYLGKTHLQPGQTLSWVLMDEAHAPLDAPAELWIDGQWVGTHAGWDAPIAYTVPEAGPSVLVLEVKLPQDSTGSAWGVTIPLKTLCTPPAPDLPPWPQEHPNNPWWVGTFYEGEPVTGMAMTRMGADGAFDKPLIVVEGFDPGLVDEAPSYGYGNMHWDAIWNCSDLAYPNTAAMPSLFDALLADGFDLVYMDFEDGTRTAFAQAALLEHVLDLVQEHSTELGRAVVVGASMGGVIARLALRERELDDTADCIRQFITLDSPHRGAYLPMALQEALGFFSLEDVQAAELMQALNSPAARELLLVTPDGVPMEHTLLIDHLDGIGWPEGPQCLAISNGHEDVGCAEPGAPLLLGSLSTLGINWAQIQLWPLPGNPDHAASTPNAHVVFDCSMPNLNGSWWADPILEGTAWCAPSAAPWETLPASTSPHIQALQAALTAQGFELTDGTEWTAFVPVPSALDSENPSPLLRRSEPLPSAPASHCDLTGHADFLLNYLEQGDFDLGYTAADAPSFPHWGHLLPHRVFLGGGTLPADATWTIGQPEGNGGWGVDWPLFHVQTAPCSSPLVIEPGATLAIGETTGQGTATLAIEAGGEIEIADGGTVAIGSGSTLIVRSGATLRLHGNGLALAAGARFVLEPGGKLDFLGSSHWQLEPSCVVELAGQIHCAAGTTWSLQAEGIASLSWQGTTTLPLGAEWQLHAIPELTVSGAAVLDGQGTTRWHDTDLFMAPGASLHAWTKQRWQDVRCWGAQTTSVTAYNRWRWQGGSAESLVLTHEHAAPSDPYFEDVSFIGCEIATSLGGPHARGCTFEPGSWHCQSGLDGNWDACNWKGSPGAPGLSVVEAAAPIRLTGCAFESLEIGLHLIHSNALLSCNEWRYCGTGVHCEAGAEAVLAGAAGGDNVFHENTVHAQFSAAPWWVCGEGNNAFGPADLHPFQGTLSLPVATGPSTFLLDASGNHWESSAWNGALTSTSGSPVALQTWPELTNWEGCHAGNGGGTPAASSPKQLPLPIPGGMQWDARHPGRLELLDVHQRVMRTARAEGKSSLIHWELGGLAPGTYFVRWTPDAPSTDAQVHPLFWLD